MRPVARLVPTILAGAVLLSGCTGGAATSAGQQAPLSDPPASALPAQPSAAAGGPTDQDAELGEPEVVPTWDDTARRGAVDKAEAAMTAFVRPDLDESAWWSQLSPLLTPAAQVAYAGTDPAQVPARSVVGAGRLVDESSAYLARVEVPTDIGPYLVLLSRDGQGAPWLVERLTPPPGAR
jgi:hypothetical protein